MAQIFSRRKNLAGIHLWFVHIKNGIGSRQTLFITTIEDDPTDAIKQATRHMKNFYEGWQYVSMKKKGLLDT